MFGVPSIDLLAAVGPNPKHLASIATRADNTTYVVTYKPLHVMFSKVKQDSRRALTAALADIGTSHLSFQAVVYTCSSKSNSVVASVSACKVVACNKIVLSIVTVDVTVCSMVCASAGGITFGDFDLRGTFMVLGEYTGVSRTCKLLNHCALDCTMLLPSACESAAFLHLAATLMCV